MCIRDSRGAGLASFCRTRAAARPGSVFIVCDSLLKVTPACLLYTSDAADERSSVDLGGRRIIKKKKEATQHVVRHVANMYNKGHVV